MGQENQDNEQNILSEIVQDVVGFHTLFYMKTLPSSTPVIYPQVVEQAAKKVCKANTSYFLTINLKDTILWCTFKKCKAPD